MPVPSARRLLVLCFTVSCGQRAAPSAAAVPPHSTSRAADSLSARPADTTTTSVRDSVRGKLVLVGTLENPTVWLSTPEGEGFRVLGVPRNILRELTGGMEVVLFGTRASGTIPGGRIFNATDYAVRALAGEPAYDGILRVDATRTVLELRDGRRLAIGRLPDALANANGKYVWISGSLASPTQGGIIDPNRVYRTPHSPRMR